MPIKTIDKMHHKYIIDTKPWFTKHPWEGKKTVKEINSKSEQPLTSHNIKQFDPEFTGGHNERDNDFFGIGNTAYRK